MGLGPEVGARLAGWLRDDGVQLELGAGVDSIELAGEGTLSVRAGDASVTADVVVMAAGATPRLELAAAAGLDTSSGGVRVDASMRTPISGLFAAGDIALAAHPIAGRPLAVEHWGDALAQGEVAGRTAAGQHAEWSAVPGFWSTIGDRTLKYAAWGDGHDEVDFQTLENDAFIARYRRHGKLVGTLTHGADDLYDSGRNELTAG